MKSSLGLVVLPALRHQKPWTLKNFSANLNFRLEFSFVVAIFYLSGRKTKTRSEFKSQNDFPFKPSTVDNRKTRKICKTLLLCKGDSQFSIVETLMSRQGFGARSESELKWKPHAEVFRLIIPFRLSAHTHKD